MLASRPLLLYLQENYPGTLFCRILSKLQSRCERCKEEKHLLSLPSIDPRLLDPLARSLRTVPTELSQLSIGSLTFKCFEFRPQIVLKYLACLY
jgi:hypothetical protein